MVSSLADTIAAAEGGLEESYRLLGTMPSDERFYFLQNALVGYLWRAIATGATILAAVRSRAASGAEPLKRVLHECYLDTLFLVTHPDREYLAAKAILGEFMDPYQLLADYKRVVADHPEAALPPVQPQWESTFGGPLADLVSRLEAENAQYGGTPGIFSRALADWERKGSYWHWSGLSRRKMIEYLVSQGALKQSSLVMVQSLTDLYNGSAHAAPAWANVSLGNQDNPRSYDDPRFTPERDLTQLAAAVEHFVPGLATMVLSFLSKKSAP